MNVSNFVAGAQMTDDFRPGLKFMFVSQRNECAVCRPVSAESVDNLSLNVQLVRLMQRVVSDVAFLDRSSRDFLFCSIVAWFQVGSEYWWLVLELE